MKDPRNEREAQPHLERQADLRYLKHERAKVRPSYRDSDWRQLAATFLGYVVGALFLGAGLYQLWRIL